ncbi:hypothetical protein OR16_04507 [Cupriavidus basilensis OR16]|uniref:Restriction endonuclease n=1 Tax=Cupriavidus basilensis OR16 TaxID=1127483 RepID=H1RZZ3_9BURK|nr:hypothetical protein OR16_04507 [Cupriavidus basilensis OR16]
MAFQLAGYAQANAPKPKLGIDEAYKGIRNRLRKYSATSIVEVALKILWAPHENLVDEVRHAPWLTLLIVKWALQDNGVQLRVGPPISIQEFDRLRQDLWDLPDLVRDGNRPTNVFLMMRSLMHVQVEFQRNEGWGFLRWPALYARLPKGHKSRQQFRDALGVEPNVFLDLVYGLYAAVLIGEMPFNGDWLSPFRRTYGADVDRVYDIFVRDLISLRCELQKDQAQRIRGRHELQEFPYLKRFPLLRQRDGRLHCWHRLVFARGVEEAVHLKLSEEFGEHYSLSFSRVFEQYVTELAAETGKPHLTEAEYKANIGGDAPSVEVIFDGDDCNVFVEAKMSLFADDVLLQDNQNAAYTKTKRVREGIGQGWRVGRLLRETAQFGNRFHKAQDFLLVVTSRELILGSGEMLQRLYEPDKFDYPDAEAAARMPLTNVFVLSIEDYECLVGCMRAGEVDISVLLKKSSEANKDGATARLFFSDFLKEYTNKWTQPTLVTKARNEAEERMLEVFENMGEQPNA